MFLETQSYINNFLASETRDKTKEREKLEYDMKANKQVIKSGIHGRVVEITKKPKM